MGLMALSRLMSMRRDRRHPKIKSRSMSIASAAKRKGSPGRQVDNPRGRKRRRYSVPDLPK
uniref:Uncharacterized protein n=1 Tax=Triticum urartu TaxID=4572 RepID=A0A8R7QIR8_TRIUA